MDNNNAGPPKPSMSAQYKDWVQKHEFGSSILLVLLIFATVILVLLFSVEAIDKDGKVHRTSSLRWSLVKPEEIKTWWPTIFAGFTALSSLYIIKIKLEGKSPAKTQ